MPSPKGRSRPHRRVSGTCFAYVTCADAKQADSIARAIVAERLAACANLLPGMRSIYWWKGRLDSADEVVLILKTRSALIPALTARVKALHSYTVPCVCALPVIDGNADYLKWLASETRDLRRRGSAARHAGRRRGSRRPR
jgi:periplasmic divalent cation tolerance protein